MGNNKDPQIVTIDGTEYDANTFTEQQKMLLEHCVDLERKIGSCRFQLDQLNVGKDAFLTLLKQSLAPKSETE
jgi:hypothetical protein